MKGAGPSFLEFEKIEEAEAALSVCNTVSKEARQKGKAVVSGPFFFVGEKRVKGKEALF